MSEDRSVFDLVEPSSGELVTYGDSEDQVIELIQDSSHRYSWCIR